ncbi:MAG: DUF4199 domain-containing protein [Gemmatimonadota bacterium]
MKRIVWTFGLIAGAIMAVMMAITIPFADHSGKWEVIGYTTMILAFLMVYFGIRTYRDNSLAGTIRFGQAFKVGILITLIASTCYVGAWEIIYRTMVPDFMEKYAAKMVANSRAEGASEAAIDRQKTKMAAMVEGYKNPVVRAGYTYLEVFPVGLVVVLVSAGVLSRRKSGDIPEPARA